MPVTLWEGGTLALQGMEERLRATDGLQLRTFSLVGVMQGTEGTGMGGSEDVTSLAAERGLAGLRSAGAFVRRERTLPSWGAQE